MEKQFLLVRICDLMDSKNALGFKLLTHDVEKVGYVFYDNSFLENYLVLKYLNPERLDATSTILKDKGVKVKIRETIRQKIHPISLKRVTLGGLIK